MGRRNKSRRHVVAPRPVAVSRNQRTKAIGVCVFLVALVAIIYGQTLRHEFINYDDEGYVTLKVVARGVAMELHEWWLGRLRDELITTSSITEEDLLLLAHERLGHSTKTIAKSLGWTTSSVDSRFQRVNVKLRVANRKAAARLAAEYGLI